MEMSAGKALDEACNRCNDAYRDEVLYAAWVQAPRADPRLQLAATPAPAETARIAALMARLCAGQG